VSAAVAVGFRCLASSEAETLWLACLEPKSDNGGAFMNHAFRVPPHSLVSCIPAYSYGFLAIARVVVLMRVKDSFASKSAALHVDVGARTRVSHATVRDTRDLFNNPQCTQAGQAMDLAMVLKMRSKFVNVA
jgi:hypothetical protein